MAEYILPSEVRPFEKMFDKLRMDTGDDYVTLFEAFLDFFIHGFDIEAKPIKHWRYNEKQNKMFLELFQIYLQLFDQKIGKLGWYDMFGDFFMAVVGKTSQQYRGQFFTPEHICDFMAKIILDDRDEAQEVHAGMFGRRKLVGDPTCGSGRLLLAAHNVYCQKGMRGRYFVGEDIDRLCVKMTAVNMCMHGCLGEVVLHDSLCHPEQVNMGFIINEGLLLMGLPSIRMCDDPKQFWATRNTLEPKEERTEPVTEKVLPQTKTETKIKNLQLSLFDMEEFVEPVKEKSNEKDNV